MSHTSIGCTPPLATYLILLQTPSPNNRYTMRQSAWTSLTTTYSSVFVNKQYIAATFWGLLNKYSFDPRFPSLGPILRVMHGQNGPELLLAKRLHSRHHLLIRCMTHGLANGRPLIHMLVGPGARQIQRGVLGRADRLENKKTLQRGQASGKLLRVERRG